MRVVLVWVVVVLQVAAAFAGWLECPVADRFVQLSEVEVRAQNGYESHVVPYFIARGVGEAGVIEDLVRQDLFHLAHALSVLFEQEHEVVLHSWLPGQEFLLTGVCLKIDHLGRELLGPLSFYQHLLSEIAPTLGLRYTRDLVFPSTQVVKVLREHDPSLEGVTIGRIYFEDDITERTGCIELFQPSLVSEKNPQAIGPSLTRFAVLNGEEDHPLQIPIDHISIELDSREEVYAIHKKILELASDILRPNQQEVSYNPGDGSTQTKVLIRNSADSPFNKIIEFVHYQNP